jgi:peptidyl-prolyl cis-trans isomerase SurA
VKLVSATSRTRPRIAARLAAATAVLIAALLVPGPAAAQFIVAVVNGQPITTVDVDQRIRLHQVSTRRTPSRQEVIEELINEKIKLQQAARQEVVASDEEVDRIFAQIARGSGRSLADFAQTLAQAGVDVSRLKTRIRSETSWRQVLQRHRPVLVRDADIVAALTARGQNPQITAIQYTLRQFVFVVPRGSPNALRISRTREAEAFRRSFSSCQEGIALARQHREVVVKDPVVRLSTELPTPLRELLERTQVNALTPPEPVPGGIEVVAVCDRKQTIADISARLEMREQLMGQRLQVAEKELLEKFRKSSIIEYRDSERRP